MASARKLWDNYQLLTEVKKNEKTKVCFFLAAHEGFRSVAVREFYLKAKTGEWTPGRDGICIPLMCPTAYTDADNNIIRKDLPVLSEMLKALQLAAEKLPEFPLEDEEHEVWYEPKARVK